MHETEEASEHKTDAEDTDTTTSGDRGEESETVDLSLSVRQALASVFALGLLVGLGAGTAVQGLPELGTEGTAPQPSDTESDTQGAGSDSPGEAAATPASDIGTDGEPVLGNKDAELTMVIYEDFQCPFCRRLEQNAFPQIESNYVDSGQVKVVWKDFPLNRIHPWAEQAAVAMECVYREGGDDVFWAVKDKVFENQDSLSTDNVESQVKQWASQEGVSESSVQGCIDRGDALEEVQGDTAEGEQNGVSGTPTAIVGDRKIVGAQPYSQFQTAIEKQVS